MNAYLYQAALLCERCGDAVKSRLANSPAVPENPNDEATYDSDEYPKGPYPDGGGEADTPQHCDACGIFLENSLTSDGYAYVKAVHTHNPSEITQAWLDYYHISIDEQE